MSSMVSAAALLGHEFTKLFERGLAAGSFMTLLYLGCFANCRNCAILDFDCVFLDSPC